VTWRCASWALTLRTWFSWPTRLSPGNSCKGGAAWPPQNKLQRGPNVPRHARRSSNQTV
jgi:hypothetical protein